ncbi:MAG: hypothetical protein Q4G43_16120 [Mobilicoccus sp.]|nr:hypothetical protein [Mobilicoccus sp.]
MSFTTSIARRAAIAVTATGLLAGLVAAPLPATASAPPVRTVTERADIDGDGRADRVQLTIERVAAGGTTLRLTTRTAAGRTATTRIATEVSEPGIDARAYWVGTAPLDGVPGEEVVLDLAGGIGDGHRHMVYTLRGGAWQRQLAPGARSFNTPWVISQHPAFGIAGYEFSTTGQTRRVVATRLTPNADGTTFSGYRTMYRWGTHGWMSSGTTWIRDGMQHRVEGWGGWKGVDLG